MAGSEDPASELLCDLKLFGYNGWRAMARRRRWEIGLTGALHVREERLTPRGDACRLMYVSDIHLRSGRSERLARQILDSAARARPHAVLLGGDLVDHATELDALTRLIAALGRAAPVFAIGGNHDEHIGFERVREAVVRGRGKWIHSDTARVTHGRRSIAVSGPECPATAGSDDVRVLCAHNPRIWKTSRRAGFDLVLAGHLHGCQVVAAQYRGRLFPGALLYPYCYLTHRSGSTRLVVSRGVSDLVPIRWRCPREVVVCHV